MIPISVGVSSLISNESSLNQSIDEPSVPVSSIYHECSYDHNLANSTRECPTNILVVEEDVKETAWNKEVSADTEEDTFGDWLQSYSESGPVEAAVDSASLFESDSASLDLGSYNYNDIPQRPRGPMVPIAIGCSDSPDDLVPYQPSDEVSVPTSPHRLVPSPSSSAPPVLSQPADSLGTPATQFAHEVESEGTINFPTPELLSEVLAGDVEEHAFANWLPSVPEFDTEEDSKELYSAVQLDPVYVGPNSNEYEDLTALASSRVHIAADSMHEESNGGSNPSPFGGPSALHLSTPSARDPQLSSLVLLSSSSGSITPLSILPSSLSISSPSIFVPSVSSPSTFVPSSTLYSFHSLLGVSPTPLVSFHDQVPLSRSISVLFPSASFSDYFLLSSPPAAAYHKAEVTCACPLDVAEPSPIVRPPEDPPPDVSDELRDWLHAHAILGIEECPLLPSSDPPALPGEFYDAPVYSTLVDDLGVGAIRSSSHWGQGPKYPLGTL